jgi:hypothetical protein
MRIITTLIGLLFSTVAVADPTAKATSDIRDLASLIAADYNKCGVVQMEKAIDYLGAMSAIIEAENPDVDTNDLMVGQLLSFEEAFIIADNYSKVMGCGKMNELIEAFRYGMKFNKDVYYFYTELGVL